MIDEQIEKKLHDMVGTLNWGTVERGYDSVPKTVEVVKETLAYINRLKEEKAMFEKALDNACRNIMLSQFCDCCPLCKQCDQQDCSDYKIKHYLLKNEIKKIKGE